jgi:hypothetical protein
VYGGWPFGHSYENFVILFLTTSLDGGLSGCHSLSSLVWLATDWALIEAATLATTEGTDYAVFSSLIKVVMAGGRIGRQFCQPLCKAGRYSYRASNSLFNTDLERSQKDATFELLKFQFDSVPYS